MESDNVEQPTTISRINLLRLIERIAKTASKEKGTNITRGALNALLHNRGEKFKYKFVFSIKEAILEKEIKEIIENSMERAVESRKSTRKLKGNRRISNEAVIITLNERDCHYLWWC